MAVDHHPSLTATFPTKKRGRPSKTELKMSLVAQRLAMLQNDHHIMPKLCAKQTREERLDDVLLKDDAQNKLSSANQKLCASSKPVRKSSNNSSPEDIIIPKSSANRRKYGSHKQKMVVSDDESSEDRAFVVKVEPRKKKSHKKKMVTSDDETLEDSAPIVEVEPREKKSHKKKMVSSDDETSEHKAPIVEVEPREKKSHKKKMVISDKESSEDRAPVVEVEPRKKKCHKKRMVISDDESSEDRALPLLVEVEPRKKKRAMQKTENIEGSLDHEASDNTRKRRSPNRDIVDDFDVKSPAMILAEEVQANLLDEYPSFVKLMLRSHVTQGFWLGLPSKFCVGNLPSYDCTMVLVDEDGQECETKFLAVKCGLSAGWRGFAINHNLHEGDVVVFQLIKPTKLKVYIVRADSLGEVDGALGLLNLDASAGQWISDPPEKVVVKEHNPLILEENAQGNSDIDAECEVVDGIRFSDTVISFESIKSFESFNIVVDGLVIDSKFSEDARKKYYELCSSQGAFLHEHLLRGLNCNLVAGIISETINIADGIKACKASSTAHDDLRVWERTLKGFELLGMNVDFLVARVSLLLGVSSEFDNIDGSTRLREARLEQARAAERMRALEDKLLELKENMKKTDLELTAELNASARKREIQMKEIDNAPWVERKSYFVSKT